MVMLNRVFSTIIMAVVCLAASAQGVCVINGTIADVELVGGKKVKKVYLTRTDEFGRTVQVAEAKVKKGKYTFKHKVADNEPVLMYTITGFGEGKGIEVFVEQGNVTVSTVSAADPCGSVVAGTPTNDTYAEYMAVLTRGYEEAEKHNDDMMKSREGIKTVSQMLRFLIDHNDSPMTPLVIERDMLNCLTPAYAEQILKSVSMTLRSHPYYHSLRNRVLADNMKFGNELPDAKLRLLSGETKQLADYRGKYVILNFWTSGCDKSAAMLEELKTLYDIIKGNDEYVIVSVSLDNDAVTWKNAVAGNGVNLEGWIHASDCAGFESPIAKMYKVDKAPRIMIVEPEGIAVSLDMDIDELVMRIEQIMSGDLYYLDKKE